MQRLVKFFILLASIPCLVSGALITYMATNPKLGIYFASLRQRRLVALAGLLLVTISILGFFAFFSAGQALAP
ncbi:MAG TPA: hypothetical protein GX716_06010 [Firmicutes bacterium]|nr:hypothetical protein [Candidatus Fermentithermobacillaceae bacterium]